MNTETNRYFKNPLEPGYHDKIKSISHTRNTSNDKFVEPCRVTIIFNPYLFRRELFWGCFGLYMHGQCCDSGCSDFTLHKSSVQLAIGPQPHLALSSAWASHAKIMLTPPSAKIYVFTPNSHPIGSLKSSWVQCLKSQWLTIEWLPLWNIPHKYTLLIHQYSEFVCTITQTNKINKQNELVSAPAKIFNDPKTCYRHVFVHKFSNMCSCQECFFRERVILVITWTNIS